MGKDISEARESADKQITASGKRYLLKKIRQSPVWLKLELRSNLTWKVWRNGEESSYTSSWGVKICYCKPTVAEVLSREIGNYTFFFGPLVSIMPCTINKGKTENDQIGHCGRWLRPEL